MRKTFLKMEQMCIISNMFTVRLFQRLILYNFYGKPSGGEEMTLMSERYSSMMLNMPEISNKWSTKNWSKTTQIKICWVSVISIISWCYRFLGENSCLMWLSFNKEVVWFIYCWLVLFIRLFFSIFCNPSRNSNKL